MKEPQMARALHINLGDQTAKKLDELSMVLEENKTALVSRLIREEWQRQRELQPPVIATGPRAGDTTLLDVAEALAGSAEARARIFSPEVSR
jgi:predicted transcriptional regulator